MKWKARIVRVGKGPAGAAPRRLEPASRVRGPGDAPRNVRRLASSPTPPTRASAPSSMAAAPTSQRFGWNGVSSV